MSALFNEPAFPVEMTNSTKESHTIFGASINPGMSAQFSGMSLRDYFAARFMARAQSLSEDRDGGWDYDIAARCSYEMADAMLKARTA